MGGRLLSSLRGEREEKYNPRPATTPTTILTPTSPFPSVTFSLLKAVAKLWTPNVTVDETHANINTPMHLLHSLSLPHYLSLFSLPLSLSLYSLRHISLFQYPTTKASTRREFKLAIRTYALSRRCDPSLESHHITVHLSSEDLVFHRPGRLGGELEEHCVIVVCVLGQYH